MISLIVSLVLCFRSFCFILFQHSMCVYVFECVSLFWSCMCQIVCVCVCLCVDVTTL